MVHLVMHGLRCVILDTKKRSLQTEKGHAFCSLSLESTKKKKRQVKNSALRTAAFSSITFEKHPITEAAALKIKQ